MGPSPGRGTCLPSSHNLGPQAGIQDSGSTATTWLYFPRGGIQAWREPILFRCNRFICFRKAYPGWGMLAEGPRKHTSTGGGALPSYIPYRRAWEV